jgi:hypothetical protein
VLEKIIYKSQSAFIQGRQILDPILIANECLDSRIRYGESSVLSKLNLKKPMIMLIGIFLSTC